MTAEWHITWSDDATHDLDEVVDRIALDSPTIAAQVFDRIGESAGSLAQLANRGRAVPEIAHWPDFPLRELIEPPLRIMYAIERDQVVIAAVVDGRRDIAAFLEDRFAPQQATDD